MKSKRPGTCHQRKASRGPNRRQFQRPEKRTQAWKRRQYLVGIVGVVCALCASLVWMFLAVYAQAAPQIARDQQPPGDQLVRFLDTRDATSFAIQLAPDNPNAGIFTFETPTGAQYHGGQATDIQQNEPGPSDPVNLAFSATATASSEAGYTSQTADKAIDGLIGGFPNDYTQEWATLGGGAGNWLKLTWPSAQTINRVVLYDRPNLDDQITGGTLDFSDGSSVPIGALNNDGTSVTITFSDKTITSLQLNITEVSASTLDSGLAEIQVYDTSGGDQAPVADPGPNQTVGLGALVRLNGSGSSDPVNASLTYQWTQTGGSSVALSSATSAQPTFTAPASAESLTFQLVVNNGQVNSDPATVTISVLQNLALSATATASSENPDTGQTADKAIDGVIDGHPGDSTKEWATESGGAGSWLKLTWPSMQTADKIVLYDRPNLDDQINGGTLDFSDGSSVPVGSLHNNGLAMVFTFSAKTITSVRLNITVVSGTTLNIGLAEIQVFDSSAGGGNSGVGTSGSTINVDYTGPVQLLVSAPDGQDETSTTVTVHLTAHIDLTTQQAAAELEDTTNNQNFSMVTDVPDGKQQAIEAYDQALINQDWATVYTLTSQVTLGGMTEDQFAQAMEQAVQSAGAITATSMTSQPQATVDPTTGITTFTVTEQMTITLNGVVQNQTYTCTYILEDGVWKFLSSE